MSSASWFVLSKQFLMLDEDHLQSHKLSLSWNCPGWLQQQQQQLMLSDAQSSKEGAQTQVTEKFQPPAADLSVNRKRKCMLVRRK